MLDTHRIRTRLKEIRKRLKILNSDFKPLSKDQLIKDEDLNAAAERHLQVAIQASIDIANHMVSALGLDRSFKNTSEIFRELSKEKILPDILADKLIGATGYRNVVVHDYLDVDRNKTYENIQEHLPDLSQFAKYIEEFIAKN